MSGPPTGCSRAPQPSDTVYNLLQRKGIVFKRHLQKKGLNEAQIDEEMKKWDVLQIERQRKAEAVQNAKIKAKPAPVVEEAPAPVEEAPAAPAVEAEDKTEETAA